MATDVFAAGKVAVTEPRWRKQVQKDRGRRYEMGQLTGFVSRGECLRVTRVGKREHGTWPCRGITVEQQRESKREREREREREIVKGETERRRKLCTLQRRRPSCSTTDGRSSVKDRGEEDTGGEAWLNWVREEARNFVSRREGTRGGLAPVICNPYARAPTTPLTDWDRDINRVESRGIA